MKTFTEEQKRALLDLAMLAMYADGHLTGVEDQRITQLLGLLGFTTGYSANQAYDAAVARARQHSINPGESSAYVKTLAALFTDNAQKQRVVSVLEDLVTSDRKVEPKEDSYMRMIRGAFAATQEPAR